MDRLAELDLICGAVLNQLQTNPSEYHSGERESLRNEVARRVRVIGAEDGLDPNHINAWCGPSKESEYEMTMRMIDVAPNEAALTVLTDRLEQATEPGKALTEEEIKSFLDMDPEFLETAKSMLREFFDRTENYRRQG